MTYAFDSDHDPTANQQRPRHAVNNVVTVPMTLNGATFDIDQELRGRSASEPTPSWTITRTTSKIYEVTVTATDPSGHVSTKSTCRSKVTNVEENPLIEGAAEIGPHRDYRPGRHILLTASTTIDDMPLESKRTGERETTDRRVRPAIELPIETYTRSHRPRRRPCELLEVDIVRSRPATEFVLFGDFDDNDNGDRSRMNIDESGIEGHRKLPTQATSTVANSGLRSFQTTRTLRTAVKRTL